MGIFKNIQEHMNIEKIEKYSWLLFLKYKLDDDGSDGDPVQRLYFRFKKNFFPRIRNVYPDESTFLEAMALSYTPGHYASNSLPSDSVWERWLGRLDKRRQFDDVDSFFKSVLILGNISYLATEENLLLERWVANWNRFKLAENRKELESFFNQNFTNIKTIIMKLLDPEPKPESAHFNWSWDQEYSLEAVEDFVERMSGTSEALKTMRSNFIQATLNAASEDSASWAVDEFRADEIIEGYIRYDAEAAAPVLKGYLEVKNTDLTYSLLISVEEDWIVVDGEFNHETNEVSFNTTEIPESLKIGQLQLLVERNFDVKDIENDSVKLLHAFKNIETGKILLEAEINHIKQDSVVQIELENGTIVNDFLIEGTKAYLFDYVIEDWKQPKTLIVDSIQYELI